MDVEQLEEEHCGLVVLLLSAAGILAVDRGSLRTCQKLAGTELSQGYKSNTPEGCYLFPGLISKGAERTALSAGG